jgi:peroxiredoxin Q/BCP
MTSARIMALAALAVAVGSLSASVAQAQKSGSAARPTAIIYGGPDVGRKAPDFSLPWATKDTVSEGGSPFSLWKTMGKTVVLTFVPRAFTPTISGQLQQFTARHDELFGSDVVVAAISPDPLETNRRYASSLALPFVLLSDPDQAVATKYGARDSQGYNRRAVYVIGPDGRVRWRTMQFVPTDPKAFAELKAAVRRAGRGV